MLCRFVLVLGFVITLSQHVVAAPIYYTADAVLPGGLGTLTAQRTNFQNAAAVNGITLASEGFNSFTEGNPIDFGPFTVDVASGSGFNLVSGNNFITTEGTGVLLFSTSGSTSVTFSFDSPINAFGIDITSIDFPNTTVSYADNIGNMLVNFGIPGVFAGATFFGVIETQPISTITFSFASSELLAFDFLQVGAATAVPEPASLALWSILGTAGIAAWRRKRN